VRAQAVLEHRLADFGNNAAWKTGHGPSHNCYRAALQGTKDFRKNVKRLGRIPRAIPEELFVESEDATRRRDPISSTHPEYIGAPKTPNRRSENPNLEKLQQPSASALRC
jgi:hypothetical protein